MLRNFLLVFIVLILFSIPKIGYSGYRIVTSTLTTGVAGEFTFEVQAAQPGDTVYIDVSGTVMLNAPITINSNIVIQGPSPKHFILDAANFSSINPIFNTNSSANIFIRGISMINSANSTWFYCQNGESLSLQNCVFKSNGKIVVDAITVAGQIKLENCSFMSNSTTGGGVVSVMMGVMKAANCTFYDNIAPAGSAGLAITFASSGNCDLLHNTFYKNDATGYMSTFYASSSAGVVTFQNNIFYNNVQNNNIIQNLAVATTDNGGNYVNAIFSFFSASLNTIGASLQNPFSTPVIDGFGMEYFPLSATSGCIDIGNPVPNLRYDARRVWRVMQANSTSTGFDADAGAVEYSPYTVDISAATGAGSFSQAISDINNGFTGNKAIVFELPGVGPYNTLLLSSSIVQIPNVIINGYSQNGSRTAGPDDNLGNVTPAYIPIEYSGGGSSVVSFLNILTDSVTIAGLSIMGYGIGIKTIGNNTKIEGCHIGVDSYGISAIGNNVGISIPVGSSGGSLIGTNSYIGFHPKNSRNIITGNAIRQISINNSGGNLIQGNFIGAFSNGISAPPFAGSEGVSISGTAVTTPNIIGGYGKYEGNLIAGQYYGVYNTMPNAMIVANFFGTDFDGDLSGAPIDFRNTTAIELTNPSAYGVYIEENIIGNAIDGISIENGAHLNYVGGNFIGLAINGTISVPLTGSGVKILNAHNNVIGGIDSLDGNFIANCNIGVNIVTLTSQMSNDSIVGNFIGLDTAFNQAANGIGIYINSNIQNVFIGDTIAGLGNRIGLNTSQGIAVNASGTNGIRISGNSMFNNGGLGIDLDANSIANIYSNPPVSNNAQRSPRLVSAVNCGSNNFTTVKYVINSPLGPAHQIEFFQADTANQEGEIYLGSTIITPVTIPDTFYMNLPSPALAVGDVIVATATELAGFITYHTSEFSASIPVTASTVVAINTSGAYCSDTPGTLTATVDLIFDFNAIVNGGTGNPVSWYLDAALTALIPTPSAFLASNNQTIYALVSDGICSDTALVTITVTSGATVAAGAVTTSVCANNPDVTLTGVVTSATGGIWSGSTGTFSPNNTTLTAVFTPSPSDIITGNVTLILTSTGTGVCPAVASTVNILITPAPIVNAGNDLTICSSGTVNLSASSTTGTGTWSGGAGGFSPSNTALNPTYTPSSTEMLGGVVSLMFSSTNNGNCLSVSDSMNLTIAISPLTSPITGGTSVCTGDIGVVYSVLPTGGSTYTWGVPSGATITFGLGTNSITVTFGSASGTISVTETNVAGCAGTPVTIGVNVNPMPVTSPITGDTSVCTGDIGVVYSVLPTGTSTYTWGVPSGATITSGLGTDSITVTFGSASGTISVTETSVAGCIGNSVTMFTNVTPAPTILTIPTDVTCNGLGNGTITTTITGGTAPFQFSIDSGANYMLGNSPFVNGGLIAGSYYAQVVDSGGCLSNTVPITIIEPAQMNSVVTAISDTCGRGIGQIIVSNVTGGTGGPYGYSIDEGNTIQASNVFNVTGGVYIVGVGDANSCLDITLSVMVGDTAGSLNLAGAVVGDTICPGEATFIQAYGGSSYNWLTSGVADPLSDSTEVLPDVSTVYVVEITSGSCFKVDSTEVIVSADGCGVGIVSNNVFSPDGDGVNDSFFIDIQNLLNNDNTVLIYNRWGDLINEFTNYNNSDVAWDGTSMGGGPVTAGTYFYVIEIPSVNYSNSGWIEVVR